MPTFRQYMEMTDVEREREFVKWCRKHRRQPEEDGVGDDFLNDYCSETEST